MSNYFSVEDSDVIREDTIPEVSSSTTKPIPAALSTSFSWGGSNVNTLLGKINIPTEIINKDDDYSIFVVGGWKNQNTSDPTLAETDSDTYHRGGAYLSYSQNLNAMNQFTYGYQAVEHYENNKPNGSSSIYGYTYVKFRMFNSGGRLTNQNTEWPSESGNNGNNILPPGSIDRSSSLWDKNHAIWNTSTDIRNIDTPNEPEKLKLRFIEPVNVASTNANSSQLDTRWRWPTNSFQKSISDTYKNSPWPASPAHLEGKGPWPFGHITTYGAHARGTNSSYIKPKDTVLPNVDEYSGMPGSWDKSPAKTTIYQFNYKMVLTSFLQTIYQYYSYYNWIRIDYWKDDGVNTAQWTRVHESHIWRYDAGSRCPFQYYKVGASRGECSRDDVGLVSSSSTANVDGSNPTADKYDTYRYTPHMRGAHWFHKSMNTNNHQNPSNSYIADNFELASNLTKSGTSTTTLLADEEYRTEAGNNDIWDYYHNRQDITSSRFRVTTSNNYRSDGWNVNHGTFLFTKAIITELETDTTLWTGSKLTMSYLASWSNSSNLVFIKTHFEHYLSHYYSHGTTAKKITTPTNNNEKWYIIAGTGSNAGKYKFVNAAHNGNGGTTERYIGDNDSSYGDAATNDNGFLEVEVLEAEIDYILVRLIGSYDSGTFGSSTAKSRIGSDKYYLGEYLRADNSTWNSYNEPWPELYKTTSDEDHYYFGGNWEKVDNPKWSGKTSDSWTGSNSYSNYVKYDKYRYTDNKPLGTVLRIEPQGDAIPPIEIKSSTNSITYPDIEDIKNNKYFKVGGSITFTLNISENVKVTGTPKLKMNTKVLLASDVTAAFINKLEFVYNVEKDDNFPHIYIPENPLIVDAGVKIQDYALNELNELNPKLVNRLDFSGYIIDATNPTLTSIEIKSYTNSITYPDINDIKNNKYFKQGSSITFTLNISENIQVTGTPKLKMNTKILDASSVSKDVFTNKLEFVYNVEKDDNFSHIYIPENPLILDTDVKLQDYASNELNPKLVRHDFPDYIIDTKYPTLSGIEIKSHNGTSYQDINDIKNNKYFKQGGSITFTLNISENIQVTGTPKLKMNTKVLLASDVTTTFTNRLEFVYNVEKDDNFQHLYIPENPLIVDSGVKIQDYTLNELNAELSRNDFSGYIIDTTNPTLTGIEITSSNNGTRHLDKDDIKNNKYFKQGGSITFTMNISENVKVTGIPKLKMNTKFLDASSVSKDVFTNKLVFIYHVENGDNFLTGLEIKENPLILEADVKIQDYADNDIALTFAKQNFPEYIVMTTPPALSNFTIRTSKGPTNDYYIINDIIYFDLDVNNTVTSQYFDPQASFTGFPSIGFTIGTTKKDAIILSNGNYTNKLTFSYTIKEGDYDDNGISILKSAGKLIEYADPSTLITDLAGNPLNREYGSDLSNPYVNYKIDAIRRVITNFKIEGSGNQYFNTYGVNSILSFIYTFNYPVKIMGSPKLQIQLKKLSSNGYELIDYNPHIDYRNGDGTNIITFQYKILQNDYADVGIAVPSNPFVIDDNNKLISSGDSRDAILNPRNAVSSNSNFKINAIFPKITTISISGPSVNNPNTKKDINSGYFKEDNEIYITINFSREVVISPYTNCKLFILTDKFTTKKLAVQPYGGFVDFYGESQDILIKINTAMGDAEGGLSIYRSPENQILFIESGTFITDRYGNPSTLTYTKDFTPYTKMPLYKVLVTKPYLTSLNITTSGSTSSYPNIYPIGSIIKFKYTFSRVVYVTGIPVIQIKLGTTSKTINYEQGSETKTLTFTYTVVENDIDTDGIQLSTIANDAKSNLINEGQITDIVGNPAVLDKDENFYIGNSNS